MTSIYKQMVEARVQIDNHYSDLYVPVSLQTSAILRNCQHSSSVFTSQIDGKLWYDIPFAYEPFWTARQDNGGTNV